MKRLLAVTSRVALILVTQILLINQSLALSSSDKENVITTEHAVLIFHSEGEHAYTDEHKQLIATYADQTIIRMKELMPALAPKMTINMKLMNRDLSIVNGVTGRADLRDEIEVSISTQHKGGISAAINAGFVATLYHELHHTVRGWVIKDNAFGPGIDIAIVNEGLAEVFAEAQVGHRLNTLSTDEDFDAWVKEILQLPVNANYGQWMFMHPDGRIAVGYRAGEYLIKKALQNTDMDIIELSELSVAEIYKLAGYEYSR